MGEKQKTSTTFSEEDNTQALIAAGDKLHATLFDLQKAYRAVQEHYGFKPEQSIFIVTAISAMREWVSASKKFVAR